MRGFEATYTDIVDYIERITHRIWEEGDVGYIDDTYTPDVRVWTDRGDGHGRQNVVTGTLQTQSAFPDIRLYADAIAWSGDEDTGFVTSHRLMKVAHHTGHSERFGPPSGSAVRTWNIATCHVHENRIYAEWLTSNTAEWHRQLGHDIVERATATADAAERLTVPPATPISVDGAAAPVELLLRGIDAIWNRRELPAIGRLYAPGLRFHGPTDREFYGRGEYRGFVVSLLSALPDLVFEVDEAIQTPEAGDSTLVATRWRAAGTHAGAGPWGPPTGRRVHLWGATQYRLRQGRIEEEWMMFNEFEVLQQIYRGAPFESEPARS